MKKFKLYCILGMFGCICLPTEARVTNWLGLSLEAGELTMMPQKSVLKPSLGVGGAFTVHYELEVNHFLFQTGIGANGGWTQFKVPEIAEMSHILPNQRDIENQLMNYIYQFSDRRDAYAPLNAQIPLLLGGNWNRFYFLAGAKLNLNGITWTWQKSNLQTAGEYIDKQGNPIFQQPITGVPAQQFYGPEDNMILSSRSKTNLNLDVNATAEIGIRLGYIRPATGFDVPRTDTQYRLAIFADYGLMDCHKAQKKQVLVAPSKYAPAVPESMTKGLKMNDILSTSNIAQAVNSLLVGIKFTILFEMTSSQKCVTCEKDAPLRQRKGGTKIER